jgi:hypothetical protein
LKRKGFREENISTQQSQAEEDSWVLREDEYQGRPQGFKTEESQGAKEVDRLKPIPFERTRPGEDKNEF